MNKAFKKLHICVNDAQLNTNVSPRVNVGRSLAIWYVNVKLPPVSIASIVLSSARVLHFPWANDRGGSW